MTTERAEVHHEGGAVSVPKMAEEVRYRVLSVKAMWIAAGVIVLVGAGVAAWLLLSYGDGGGEQRNQLEAIKTAGTIVVGAGGAIALLLAARRQRSAEIALKQKDRDQALQEQVAADARADAAARRITELYTKAADQLGSDKAPVRLAGLYALERLAQDNPGQRQTVVNVVCAYLRMPYQLPGEPPPEDADGQLVEAHRERTQEREVRLTAQRLLTEHLAPGDGEHLKETFWANIDLDLSGAVLINFDLQRCAVRLALFRSARFTGYAAFWRVTFTDHAAFRSASFSGEASFDSARFFRDAGFWGATFNDDVSFEAATVRGGTSFKEATFASTVNFKNTEFVGELKLESVAFQRGVPAEIAPLMPTADGG